MKSNLPELTVIIPTRNRAVTLEAALRTCTAQNYDRLTILVSDNASTDNTLEVVRSFNDIRIRYVNTSKRMSMTRNWEFALSHVVGGYVTFLGDDDGLIPNAASDIASLIQETGAQAISWNKAEYHWPSHPNFALRNVISIPAMNVLVEIPATLALRHATRFWLPYNKLPTVYNSFVAYNVIASAKQKNGSFFMSVTPDVYSGFALMKVLNSYLYSSRPFSVNGASASSNGSNSISGSRLQGESAQFMSEFDLEQNETFQVIPGAIYSSIAEALCQADKYCFNSRLSINKKLIIKLILRDIYLYLPEQRQHSLDALYKMVARYGLKDFAEERGNKVSNIKSIEKLPFEVSPRSVIQRGSLVFDAENFNVKDVFDACKLTGNLLPIYRQPSSIVRYSFLTLIFTFRCTDFGLYSELKEKSNLLLRLVKGQIASFFSKYLKNKL